MKAERHRDTRTFQARIAELEAERDGYMTAWEEQTERCEKLKERISYYEGRVTEIYERRISKLKNRIRRIKEALDD
jgi:DNA replication initiation complex subunit (GINS family)